MIDIIHTFAIEISSIAGFRQSPTASRFAKGFSESKRNMTSKTAKVNNAKVVRTTAGLRDAIFDEIDAIRDGTGNPTRANAVAKLASGITDTVRMEMEVQRHLRSIASESGDNSLQPALGIPMRLGN